jgi:hypothetical protein
MRKEFDFYPTPTSIVTEIAKRWSFEGNKVWEPCTGDGRMSEALEQLGCEVVSTDISNGEDFFTYSTALADVIITNPPFKYIRQFIDHAFAVGIKQMALVCPERLWACKKGRAQFERHRPTRWANLDWREDYLQKGGSPDRALAVAMWNIPNSENCFYEIWNK